MSLKLGNEPHLRRPSSPLFTAIKPFVNVYLCNYYSVQIHLRILLSKKYTNVVLKDNTANSKACKEFAKQMPIASLPITYVHDSKKCYFKDGMNTTDCKKFDNCSAMQMHTQSKNAKT